MASAATLKERARALLSDEQGTLFGGGPLRAVMLYPSPYRVGMSSLGYQILYREVHERAEWSAERAFLPDAPEDYRKSRVPLFTLESQSMVSDAHVIGVSLAYELEVPGLLECLELARIPLRAADRTERDPLILVGGPLTFSNPLPAAPFADVVVMGEGEALIHRILDEYEGAASKDELLRTLSRVPGCYVPQVHGERLLPVVAADNARLPGFGQIVTPNTELANMHLVEAERGCHRKCTFCVMRRSTNGGMRLARPADILATVPEGAPRVGLVGAAVSDHPKLVEIVRSLVDAGKGVGLSSMRADRLSPALMDALTAGGYRTLTVASDGPSERLRVQLQKAIREKHLFDAAHYVAEYKLRTLKLYMMVGVPGEEPDDIEELIAFATEVSSICRVALGIAPFVAKRNTPLDREPFAGIKTVERTLKRLKSGLRGRVDLRSTSAKWAWVEYEMAQGGFDMADAAEQAWRDGGAFAAWRRAIAEHRRDEQPVDEALRLGVPDGRFADEGYAALRGGAT